MGDCPNGVFPGEQIRTEQRNRNEICRSRDPLLCGTRRSRRLLAQVLVHLLLDPILAVGFVSAPPESDPDALRDGMGWVRAFLTWSFATAASIRAIQTTKITRNEDCGNKYFGNFSTNFTNHEKSFL